MTRIDKIEAAAKSQALRTIKELYGITEPELTALQMLRETLEKRDYGLDPAAAIHAMIDELELLAESPQTAEITQ